MTLPELSAELLPCRECGAPCQVEVFDSERVKATIWICSQHERLGGACSSGAAYLSEAAWNTRTGQLVERDAVDLVGANTLPTEYARWLSSIEVDVRVHDLTADEVARLIVALKGGEDA